MVGIHFIFPVYCAYWKYFGTTQRTRSARSTGTRSNNRTIYCQYLAVPAVQLPEILEVQQYSTSRVLYSSGELRNITSMALSAVHNLEIISASTRGIRSIFSRKHYSIVPGAGSICESIHSQIDGPSSGRSSKFLLPGATGVFGVY